MKGGAIDVVWTAALLVVVTVCTCAMMSRSCDSPVLRDGARPSTRTAH